MNHNRLPQLPPLPVRLEHLELRHNAFQQFPPSVSDARWLRYLDLSYNQIPAIPPSIAQLSRLEQLKAMHNPIQSFQPNLLLLDHLSQATGVLPGRAKQRFRPFINGCQRQKIQGDAG